MDGHPQTQHCDSGPQGGTRLHQLWGSLSLRCLGTHQTNPEVVTDLGIPALPPLEGPPVCFSQWLQGGSPGWPTAPCISVSLLGVVRAEGAIRSLGRVSLGQLWRPQLCPFRKKSQAYLCPSRGPRPRPRPGGSLLNNHRWTLFSQLVATGPPGWDTPLQNPPEPHVATIQESGNSGSTSLTLCQDTSLTGKASGLDKICFSLTDMESGPHGLPWSSESGEAMFG